jgi:hypothetical protein
MRMLQFLKKDCIKWGLITIHLYTLYLKSQIYIFMRVLLESPYQWDSNSISCIECILHNWHKIKSLIFFNCYFREGFVANTRVSQSFSAESVLDFSRDDRYLFCRKFTEGHPTSWSRWDFFVCPCWWFFVDFHDARIGIDHSTRHDRWCYFSRWSCHLHHRDIFSIVREWGSICSHRRGWLTLRRSRVDTCEDIIADSTNLCINLSLFFAISRKGLFIHREGFYRTDVFIWNSCFFDFFYFSLKSRRYRGFERLRIRHHARIPELPKTKDEDTWCTENPHTGERSIGKYLLKKTRWHSWCYDEVSFEGTLKFPIDYDLWLIFCKEKKEFRSVLLIFFLRERFEDVFIFSRHDGQEER